MKRLLVVLEQGDRLPSGVTRGLAYRELFVENSFTPTFVARQPHDWFDQQPLRAINRSARVKNRLFSWAIRANERRIVSIARDSDVVYLSKVYSLSLVEAIKQRSSARIVYDLIDAVWVNEWETEKLVKLLKIVDAITTDNEVTAQFIRSHNPNCVVVPDAPALRTFDERRKSVPPKSEERIVLGWLGSPGTAYNLYVVWEALEKLFSRHPHIDLRLVGTGHDSRLLPEFENVRYSTKPFYNEQEMVDEVFDMHIGLFPLQDVERCRMRGVFKATNYMCGEAVVVASPVGQCVDFIKDGENGMLAGSTTEWIEKLDRLIGDAELRRRLASAGLDDVRSQFRIEQSFAKLKSVLLNGNS